MGGIKLSNYLAEMDKGIKEFIGSKINTPVLYVRGEIYYYKSIDFIVDKVEFNCFFVAAKIKKTTILLIDKASKARVYLSDYDIRCILNLIKQTNGDFYGYLKDYFEKIIINKDLYNISFKLNEKIFNILGIPFSENYSSMLCRNPADIKLNGNDLIGLLNLIVEKERTDNDKAKVRKTCEYYLGIK